MNCLRIHDLYTNWINGKCSRNRWNSSKQQMSNRICNLYALQSDWWAWILYFWNHSNVLLYVKSNWFSIEINDQRDINDKKVFVSFQMRENLFDITVISGFQAKTPQKWLWSFRHYKCEENRLYRDKLSLRLDLNPFEYLWSLFGTIFGIRFNFLA